MNDPKAWATARKFADILMHGHKRVTAQLDPRTLVQGITGNVVLNGGPLERFSKERPVYINPQPTAHDYHPIDVLYGSYDPMACTIDIYVENIRRDAALYGEYEDFLQIVRIHEYAHAIVHLGIPGDRVMDTLQAMGEKGYTDWSRFLDVRTQAFRKVDTASHEFLAQAITFAALSRFADGRRSDQLRATFDALEKRQPPHYVIPGEIKESLEAVDWPLVIGAARSDLGAFRGHGFSLCDGLRALAALSISSSDGPTSTDREWVVEIDGKEIVDDLKNSFRQDSQREAQSAEDRIELLLDNVGSLRIEVFAREHPPPHFRVVCGSESANYRIADCRQLNGGLRRQYRVVREWHANNKQKIIEAWNRRRPSDCPVGEYREP